LTILDHDVLRNVFVKPHVGIARALHLGGIERRLSQIFHETRLAITGMN